MAILSVHPVEISPLVPWDRHRHVRMQRVGGGDPLWEACSTQNDLRAALKLFRPDVDLNDPTQVHWAGGHPGEWPED